MIVLPHPISHLPKSVQPREQDVIEAIRQDDERAYETVFRQHYAPLCRYARQFLADADEAEEEVQAMFLALWEKREGFLITTSLKAYLFRAVHNRCLNRIKHFAVREEYQQLCRSRLSNHYPFGGTKNAHPFGRGLPVGPLCEWPPC